MILHAGCMALRVGQLWRGVLLVGPSGAGKSDLALRLLQRRWRLVADDRTRLWTSGGVLFGAAPEAIAGLLEVRGVDVTPVPALRLAQIALQMTCEGEPERLPEPRVVERSGVAVPAMRLDPLHASAPDRLRLALFAAVQQAPLESAPERRI